MAPVTSPKDAGKVESPDRKAQKLLAAQRSRERDRASIAKAKEVFVKRVHDWLRTCSNDELARIGRLAFACLHRTRFFTELADGETAAFGFSQDEEQLAARYADLIDNDHQLVRPLALEVDPQGRRMKKEIEQGSFLHFLRLLSDPRLHRGDGSSTTKRNFEFGNVVNNETNEICVHDAVIFAVHVVMGTPALSGIGRLQEACRPAAAAGGVRIIDKPSAHAMRKSPPHLLFADERMRTQSPVPQPEVEVGAQFSQSVEDMVDTTLETMRDKPEKPVLVDNFASGMLLDSLTFPGAMEGDSAPFTMDAGPLATSHSWLMNDLATVTTLPRPGQLVRLLSH